MPLEQLGKERGGDEAFRGAVPALERLGELLGENGGPFFTGATPSYADFVVVGLLTFIERVAGQWFGRVLAVDERLRILYEAAKPWLERDDH